MAESEKKCRIICSFHIFFALLGTISSMTSHSASKSPPNTLTEESLITISVNLFEKHIELINRCCTCLNHLGSGKIIHFNILLINYEKVLT